MKTRHSLIIFSVAIESFIAHEGEAQVSLMPVEKI